MRVRTQTSVLSRARSAAPHRPGAKRVALCRPAGGHRGASRPCPRCCRRRGRSREKEAEGVLAASERRGAAGSRRSWGGRRAAEMNRPGSGRGRAPVAAALSAAPRAGGLAGSASFLQALGQPVPRPVQPSSVRPSVRPCVQRGTAVCERRAGSAGPAWRPSALLDMEIPNSPTLIKVTSRRCSVLFYFV